MAVQLVSNRASVRDQVSAEEWAKWRVRARSPRWRRAREACEYAHGQFMAGGNFLTGGKDWAACLRLADRLDPSFKE